MNTTDTTSVELAARDLRPLLTGLGKTVSKSALPILGCIRISTTKSGHAELATTDLDRWSSVRIQEAATGTPAEFLVPIDALRQLAKSAKPADPIVIRPSERGREIKVQVAGIPRTISAPSVDDYPSPPSFNGKAQPLPDGARRAILEATRCASTDEGRLILNGVHLDTTGKGHHIIGTDGRHLYSANSFKLPLAKPATMATHPLLTWKPIQKSDAPWSIRLTRDSAGSGGAFELTTGTWRIIGKLIEGNYPAWRQVVPDRDRFIAGLTVDPDRLDEIVATIKALKIEPTAQHHRPLILRKEGDDIVMHWRDAEAGKAKAQPLGHIKSVGKPFTVQIDQPLLAKALGFGLGHLQIGDEIDPVLFSGNGGRQMLAMPLRMTDRTAPPPLKTPAREPQPTTTMPPKPERARNPAPTAPRPPIPAGDPCPVDAALADLAALKDKLRSFAGDLQGIATKLKQAKQRQRTSEREVRQVRNTIETLRKVRL